MPQGSVGYAVARISVMRREHLDAAKLDRLLAAQQPQEALNALQEFGWGNGDKGADYELLAGEHVRQACAFVREVSPDTNITDCFLLRYDIHNLKMLLKARCLKQEAAYLSPCGLWSIDALRHAVADGRYSNLPDTIAEPLAALEKRLAVREDPMDIDVTLDRAMFSTIFERLGRVSSKVIRQYFTARVDLTNAIIVLRVRAMGRAAGFLSPLLIEGGSIAAAKWIEAFANEGNLPRLLTAYGRRVVGEAQGALAKTGALPGLERAMDDYLLSLFKPYRSSADRIETIIGYLLSQEREAAAVRLVMAGKLNGFSADAIRERLRELYD